MTKIKVHLNNIQVYIEAVATLHFFATSFCARRRVEESCRVLVLSILVGTKGLQHLRLGAP